MDIGPFEYHDWMRLGTTVICVVSIVLLGLAYRRNSSDMNAKAKDYWYALMAWSIAGIVICVEGMLRNLQFGYRSIFVIAASTIMLKALLAKGEPSTNDQA